MEAFPDAKVVLTVRDPVRWHRSVRDSIHRWKVLIANQVVPRLFLTLFGRIRSVDVGIGITETKPKGFKHSE